ncbi:hypothetical protein JW962_01515 [Candidatus Dojkabacteria bacterium]|nr:hypothetical protein [Candidatus Dojkabacteria bacterium]
MKSQNSTKLFIAMVVISVLGIGTFIVFRDQRVNYPHFLKRLGNNIDQPSIDPTESAEKEDTPVNFTYSISLPLAETDFYEGKYDNAVAGLNAFMSKYSNVYPDNQISLIRDKLFFFVPENGYVETSKGFAFGVCWFVTTLGGLIDNANTDWNNQFGQDLFIVSEAHGHGITYPTYFPNNGYGYSVYQSGDYIIDYVFYINPEFNNIDHIEFNFWGETNSQEGYNGLSIEGELTVILK